MIVLIEKYIFSAEKQFVILAALRSDFYRVVTTTAWGSWRHENHCSKFWQQGNNSCSYS